jgi:hypothetical protein
MMHASNSNFLDAREKKEETGTRVHFAVGRMNLRTISACAKWNAFHHLVIEI